MNKGWIQRKNLTFAEFIGGRRGDGNVFSGIEKIFLKP